MKKIFFNIIKTLFVIASLVMSVSCSGIDDTTETNSEKPVLKIILSENEKTIVPTSDFTNFTFVLKAGESILGTYEGAAALEADAIDLDAKGFNVNDEVTFTLSAEKDGVKWSGSSTKSLTTGENAIEIKLFVTALGTGNGSIVYTLDFSKADKKERVVSAHVIIQSVTDSEAAPIVDEWYGLNEDGTEAVKKITDYKFLVEKENVPSGNYHAWVTFFAEASETGKITDWGDVIVVAEETISRGTAEIKGLPSVYLVTFDLNYDGSNSIQKKVAIPIKLSDLAPKIKRNGYVFRGWYEESDCKTVCTESKTQNLTWYNRDITLYAKWVEFAPTVQTVSVFDSETKIFSPENYTVAEFTENTKSFWYKFNTIPGKQYKLAVIQKGWESEYISNGNVLDENSGFVSVGYYMYDQTSDPLTIKKDIFTAESTETYINIESADVGKCAFRISNYDPNVTDSMFAFVSVQDGDIDIKIVESTSYLALLVTNYSDFEKQKWYVNGKFIEEVTPNYYFWLYFNKYAAGTYTVTVEAEKKSDGTLCSCSTIVTVPEIN